VPSNPFVASAVATLIISQQKLLLGKRFEKEKFIGWQCPGGYLKTGETIEDAALRTCIEKAGIHIKDSTPGPYTNNIFSTEKHTTTLYVIAKTFSIHSSKIFKNPKTEWRWFELTHLPETLYLPLLTLQQQCNLSSF